MAKSLYSRSRIASPNFGTRNADRERLMARVDRHIVRRHTHAGYDRCMELAAQDFARHVALEVSPRLAAKPTVTFQPRSVVFGRRMRFLNGE